MITATEAGLSVANWEALRDATGDIYYKLQLEQYAPEWAAHDTVGGRSHTTCFDAVSLSDRLIRAIGGTDIITVDTLLNEDGGDEAWSSQNVTATGIDTSVSLSIAFSGATVRVFYYNGTNVYYVESLDSGATWGAAQLVGAVSDLECLAASATDRVYFFSKTTTKENHLLSQFYYDGSWTEYASHIRWPLPIGTMDAIAIGDTDSIVVAVDFPPYISRAISGTTLVWKINRVSGFAIFHYDTDDAKWSNYYMFDLVDQYNNRRRNYPKLSSYSDWYFLTYWRSDGDFVEHDGIVCSRSKDSPIFELPSQMNDGTLVEPAILLVQGNYVYLLNSITTRRSDSVAFNGNATVTEDITSYVKHIESTQSGTRNTSVLLSNPSDVLRGAGKLLGSEYAMQAVLDLGYTVSGSDLSAQVLIADVSTIGRSETLPIDNIRAGLSDRLSLTNIIIAEGANEWESQQIGADTYIDPTNTGYGGLKHTSPQAGSFETTNQELRIRSSNQEAIAWSTLVSNVFCGNIERAVKCHYSDKDEYIGTCFWAADKDNLWYTAWHPDEDTIYLVERQDGSDTVRASYGGLGWGIDVWYYLKVDLQYAKILVSISTDGVTWTNIIDYERATISVLSYLGLSGLPLTCGWTGLIGYGYTPKETWEDPGPPVVYGDEIVIVGTEGGGVYIKIEEAG